MFNTYRVRNYFVPNPTNSKLIRLKKDSKNIFLLQLNKENLFQIVSQYADGESDKIVLDKEKTVTA